MDVRPIMLPGCSRGAGHALRRPSDTKFPLARTFVVGAEPEGRSRRNHPYFCPSLVRRAADRSALPRVGVVTNTEVGLLFGPTSADASRTQRRLREVS